MPRSRPARRQAAAGLALGLLGFGSAAAGLAASRSAGRTELLVFAAVSLADALGEIGNAWQPASGERLSFNFGATSDLARQIRAGAPADVFFSADAAHVDRLERDGFVRAGDRRELLSNTLVVIVPAGAPAPPPREARALASLGSLALADPEAVPAGVYAREWLASLGLWHALAGRVVPTLDARAALAAVASGDVAAGVVYRTDALQSKRVRIAFEVERSRGPRIRYVVAQLASSHAPAAAAFVAHLSSAEAGAVFARHGFVVLGAP